MQLSRKWVESEALVKKYIIVFCVTCRKKKEEKVFTPVTISESFFSTIRENFCQKFLLQKCRSTFATDINDNSKK